MVPPQRIQGFNKSDEVSGDQPGSLVNQLVKRMLPVCSWFSPIDRPSRIVDLSSSQSHMLAVALHRQLLQVSREALEILLVRQNGDGFSAEEIGVPHR